MVAKQDSDSRAAVYPDDEVGSIFQGEMSCSSKMIE